MTLPRPNTDRRTRSHSQLADYLHCGWAFRLKRLKRVAEAPSVWLAGGKAFHTATEAHDIAEWEIRQRGGDLADLRDPEPFVNAFDDAFRHYCDEIRENDPDESTWRTAGRKTKDKPYGENVAWWAENGKIFVENYVKWKTSVEDTLVTATVEGGPAVEIELETPIGGIPMKSYVDVVMQDLRTGSLLIVDKKSGSRTPASPTQLVTYSLQLEKKLAVPVTWGAFYDARKGVLLEPIDLSLWTDELTGALYRNLDKAVESGIFLPRIDSHCKACGVRSACVFQGGVEPTNPQGVQ